MTVFDFAILAIILLSALISLARGFMRETLSLLGWVLAFFAAYWFAGHLAPFFTFLDDPELRYWSAVVAVFLVTLLLFGIVNFSISHYLLGKSISGTDRILGVALGAARGIVVAAVLIVGMQFANGRLIELANYEWWFNSRLVPEFASLSEWLLNAVGSIAEAWRDHISETQPR